MFLLFVRYLHGGRRTPSELGILIFELGIVRQGAFWIIQFWTERMKPVFMSSCQKHVFLSKLPRFTSCQCKPRRLWRPRRSPAPTNASIAHNMVRWSLPQISQNNTDFFIIVRKPPRKSISAPSGHQKWMTPTPEYLQQSETRKWININGYTKIKQFELIFCIST